MYSRISMHTRIGTEQETVQLRNFTLRMDDTELKGTAGYGLDGGAISADLQGNRLNLDRYLPPEPEEGTEAAAATETDAESDGAATSNGDKELLPLETLRTLTLNIRLGLDQLLPKPDHQ